MCERDDRRPRCPVVAETSPDRSCGRVEGLDGVTDRGAGGVDPGELRIEVVRDDGGLDTEPLGDAPGAAQPSPDGPLGNVEPLGNRAVPSPRAWANSAAPMTSTVSRRLGRLQSASKTVVVPQVWQRALSAVASGAVRQAPEAIVLARGPKTRARTHSHTAAGQRTEPPRRPRRRRSPPSSRSGPRSTGRIVALPIPGRKGQLVLDDDRPDRPGATRPRLAGPRPAHPIDQGRSRRHRR